MPSSKSGTFTCDHTEYPYDHQVVSISRDLRFEWDPRKARSNLETHGVRFETAADVFNDPMRLEEDDRFSQGEYRAIVVGQADGTVLTVVYSEPEENLIRIISARRATAMERKAYDHSLLQP